MQESRTRILIVGGKPSFLRNRFGHILEGLDWRHLSPGHHRRSNGVPDADVVIVYSRQVSHSLEKWAKGHLPNAKFLIAGSPREMEEILGQIDCQLVNWKCGCGAEAGVWIPVFVESSFKCPACESVWDAFPEKSVT